MATILLTDLKKSYQADKEVIRNFNLDIRDGEFIVLVGPSGCGKSTILRMIAGLETITSGEIAIGGKVVNRLSPKDRDIAMVFQNYALYPHMNVYNNLAFGLKLRKFSKQDIHDRVLNTAKILEIESYLQVRPKELSGGQRQRVALGRAIVRDPKVFLFDEPLSNLDAKLRVQMRAEIKHLHQTLGTTMIYVTHDQVEAMTMGDRIVVLNDGVMQQVGTPMEIYREPDNVFVGSFIGSPAMNFIDGHVKSGQFFSGILKLDLPNANSMADVEKPVRLGIRPEDITLGEGTLSLDVTFTEALGNEVLVHCVSGDLSLVIRYQGSERIATGDPISVALNPDQVHLFDPLTGRRL